MKFLALLFAGSLFLMSCGDTTSTSDNITAAPEQKPDEQAMQVTSKEYSKQYQDNEVAADNLYKGKKLAITGTVESINKDVTDDVYISLVGEGEMAMDIQCHLTDDKKAAEVKKGSQITIVGTGDGMVIGFPQIKDCVIK